MANVLDWYCPSIMASRVIVLGATGPVGTRVITIHEGQGHHVSAVTRRAQPLQRLARGDWIHADLDQPGASLDLSGYSLVVSLMPIHIASRILRHSQRDRVERCVAVSSTSVSTKNDSRSYDERALATRLYLGEQTIVESFPTVTVLRPTMI